MDDHGGNIDYARSIYGGEISDWLDLSTGINLNPYPFSDISSKSVYNLPRRDAFNNLQQAARVFYGVPKDSKILTIAGVQTGIHVIPFLMKAGVVKILSPTYSEYTKIFANFGWEVILVSKVSDLRGSDIAVLVNPNNPDGRVTNSHEILELVPDVKEIIIDESFADLRPEISMVPFSSKRNITVFKSMGKFFGLAGLRLGFAIGNVAIIDKMRSLFEPWQVSGPALEIGARALVDTNWIAENKNYLLNGSRKLSKMLAKSQTLEIIGSTGLFHLIHTDSSLEAQKVFAENKIWTRKFSYSKNWLRIGIPGNSEDWKKLDAGLAKFL